MTSASNITTCSRRPCRRGIRSAWFYVAWLSTALGCGGTTATADVPASTAEDPQPHVPRPSDSRSGERQVAIRVGQEVTEISALVLRCVQALAEGDRAQLARLLGDPLGRVSPQLGARTFSRDTVLRRIAQRRRGSSRPVSADQLIDVERLEVQPIERVVPGSLPTGYRAGDVVASFPLRAEGARLLTGVGWAARGSLVLRTQPEPRVLGL